MFLFLWSALALAGPSPLVTVGDALVPADGTQVGPWSAVLADCLQEGAPGRWSVLDRTQPGATAQGMLAESDALQQLRPQFLVVSIGPRTLPADLTDAAEIQASLTGLVKALRGPELPRVLLISVVPRSLRLAAEGDLDVSKRLETALATVADAAPDIRYLPSSVAWPADITQWSALATETGELSTQGHARLAAAACDALLSWSRAR